MLTLRGDLVSDGERPGNLPNSPPLTTEPELTPPPHDHKPRNVPELRAHRHHAWATRTPAEKN